MTFTDVKGVKRYAGWFWGQRGDVDEAYDSWSNRTFKEAAKSDFKEVEVFPISGEFLGFCDDRQFFKNGLAEDFVKEGKSFLVPIQTKSFSLKNIEYLKRVKLPRIIKDYPRAIITFFDLEEASIIPDYLEVFRAFCTNNSLDRNRVLILTANFKLKSPDFHIIQTNFFKDYLWFLKGVKKREYPFDQHLKEIESVVPTKHFLCLNRRQTWERAAIVGFLKQLPVEEIISLGRGYESFTNEIGADFLNSIRGFREESRLVDRAMKYYEEHKNEIVLCSPDEEKEIYENRVDCNQSLYLDSCISVVTETWFEEKERIFFSEKVFKPVFCLRPFILVSVPGSLACLRKQGFQTFDRWWDESYDLEENQYKRLDLIGKVIEDLSKKPLQELQNMVEEMKPVLYNNYSKLTGFPKLFLQCSKILDK